MSNLIDNAYTQLNNLTQINADDIQTESINTKALYINNILFDPSGIDISDLVTTTQLTTQLTPINNDISGLKLKTTNITKCNLPFGTLKVVKTKRKIMPSKVTMKDKYISFFNSSFDEHFVGLSAEEKADMMYRYIYIDNIEYKEESNITMTYSKDFKDSFKQLTL